MRFNNYAGSSSNSSNNNSNSYNANNFSASRNMAQAINHKQNPVKDLLINYNKTYKNMIPAQFRNKIITEIYAILLADKKPNALLVGEAGVGKTEIAQEIARQIANNDPRVPSALNKSTIYELPLSNIIAGSSLVGQTEAKIKEVLKFATDPTKHAILFIDEIHQLMQGDSDPEYTKLAQILKPALARGNLKVIGATTTQEARDLLRDPAFSRRFSRVTVNELTKKQELEILKQNLPHLINHYHNKVDIKDNLLPALVNISDTVLRPSTHRPDSGLTLLDRSLAEAIVIKKEQIAKMKNNLSILQILKADPKAHVNQNSLKKTATKIVTGVGNRPIISKERLIKALKPVLGQDKPKQEIIKSILLSQLNIFNQNKPFSFLLAGSSGVGKTMLAKIVAKAVTGTEPIIINLTEYNSSASINRIIGSAAGYVGSDSHQELPFDILESNPYQVILLDEFEKANPAVQRLFMRVLDEGKLQLANNHIIDFSKTIIFATTNASHTRTSMNSIGFNSENNAKPEDSLEKTMDTELLNRFSRIIDFNSIDKEKFKEILQQKYLKYYPKLNQTLINMPKKLDSDTLDKLTKKYYDEAFGARPAQKALEQYIEDKI